MSETQSDGNANVLGMTSEAPAETSLDSSDKEMRAIWDKHNGPQAVLNNPEMPPVPQGEDEGKAAWAWIHMPKKDRVETAAVYREFSDLKKQAEALGMKTESAADIKAVQDMLAGKDQKPAAIDQETQASLDTYKMIVPNAKDHIEARQHLSMLAEHVQRDPKGGSRAVLAHLGIDTPLSLLTPQEWEMAREHLMRNQPAPQRAEPAEDSSVASWAAKRGVSVEDQRAMGDIVSEPTWREIAGESLSSTLDRAYKALQRRGRPSAEGRINRAMDDDMRALAADIYRR